MFGRGYRKRLETDLERWVADGLLARSVADTMLADRRGEEQGGVLTALAFVVVIMLAAGLIGLVAANWQQIPPAIRVAGLMSANVAVLAACLAFTLRLGALSLAVEASAALAVLSAAASISLIGQIYHLPSNWPGFGLAMMAVAGATALVTRSAACVWLTVAAAILYRYAAIEAGPGLFFFSRAADASQYWAQYDVIVIGASCLLAASILVGWTGRAGPWTMLIALAPLFWVLGGAGIVPWAIGRPLACLAAAIVIAEVLRREAALGPSAKAIERLDAAISAMLGLAVIALALLATQHVEYPIAAQVPRLGVSLWASALAVVFALALAAGAVWRGYGDRAALFWLAAALAAPFLAELFLGGSGGPSSRGAARIDLARTTTLVLLPLVLLAVEARLSERRKTFAGCIIVMIAVVTERLWSTSDLLTFAAVMTGGGLVALAALLAVRFLPALRRAPSPKRKDA